MERQQVGRNTWKKIAEIPGVSSYRDTGVERGRKYCYRIRAVTAEGTSEVMETEEMQAGTLGKQSWLLTKLNHTEITECKLHILIFIVGFICLQQKRKLFIMKCQIDDLVTAHCHQFSKRFKKICQSKLQVADIQLKAKCDLPISLLVRYIQCICDDGT